MLLLIGLLLLFTKGIKYAENRGADSASHSVSDTSPIDGTDTTDSALDIGETATADTGDAGSGIGRTVMIDPGHGGSDPGKIGINGSKEKDINLAISKELKACLEDAGIRVSMTREDENGLYKDSDSNKKQADMRNRCEIINNAKADLTVSVHQNSYTSESVSGPQVFYHLQSAEGEKAAACIQEALNSGLSISHPRKTKSNNTYYILKKTKTPVVIAECGFLSNYEEAEMLTTSAYQKKVAKALCAGILAYLEESEG